MYFPVGGGEEPRLLPPSTAFSLLFQPSSCCADVQFGRAGAQWYLTAFLNQDAVTPRLRKAAPVCFKCFILHISEQCIRAHPLTFEFSCQYTTKHKKKLKGTPFFKPIYVLRCICIVHWGTIQSSF